MSILATLEALAAAGGTPEQLIAVVRAHEASRSDALTKRRAADAARQQAARDRKNNVRSRDDHVTGRDSRDPSPHVGEPAQVVTPSLPSLRSEEVKNPTHSSSAPPKSPKASRSRFVPDEWQPSDELRSDLIAKGFTPGEMERELTKFRDHEYRDPHSDWPRAFRKWMTNSRQFAPRQAPHERPHHDAKLEARHANYARSFAGAERASGREWKP